MPAIGYRVHMQHVAAIDAGSNGIRLVIGQLSDDGSLDEVFSVREAVRLGADAFGDGRFHQPTIEKAVEAFTKFRRKLDAYDVQHVRAVATSAAREAENGDALADAIREQTGINLEIIDGLEEAQLIFQAVSGHVELHKKTALLIDMGGGSVEVTVAKNRRALGCETLPLGPVRFLEYLEDNNLTESDVPKLIEKRRGAVKSMIEAELPEGQANIDIAVGSGGNIVRLGKLHKSMLGDKASNRVHRELLKKIINRLSDMTIEQRMTKLGMRADRADVIVIAGLVLQMILDDAQVDALEVPGVGLKEGLLRQVARSVRADAHSPRFLNLDSAP